MSRTAYAQPGDLQALLETCGVYDEAWNLDLAGALNKATDDLQQDSGYKPFKAARDAQGNLIETERKFTPDGPTVRSYTALVGGSRVLFLGTGLLSLSQLTIDGTEFTQDVHFWLEPESAIEEGEPFTRIRFDYGPRCKRQGIAITGVWGFCAELPETVYQGHLAKAALHLAPVISSRLRSIADSKQASVVKARESGPVREEYAAPDASKTTTLATQVASWQGAYEKALEGRRVIAF